MKYIIDIIAIFLAFSIISCSQDVAKPRDIGLILYQHTKSYPRDNDSEYVYPTPDYQPKPPPVSVPPCYKDNDCEYVNPYYNDYHYYPYTNVPNPRFNDYRPYRYQDFPQDNDRQYIMPYNGYRQYQRPDNSNNAPKKRLFDKPMFDKSID
ncbi:hypothetical protein N9W34_06495 [Rickettsiales bacterium]|nr:hypothetical protein [Rickettsiales bacterium]